MPCLIFGHSCHEDIQRKSDHTMFKLTVAFVFIACFVLTAEAYRLSGPHGRVPNPRFRDPTVERFFQVSV